MTKHRVLLSRSVRLLIGSVFLAGSFPAYSTDPLFFNWDIQPTGFTTFYESQETPPGREFCDPVQIKGIRSGYTGGVYGVDADRNGTRDGSLTAELELISEVSQISADEFLYTWNLRNLGTGAAITFLASGPDFGISSDYPLLGIAGADRIVAKSDDLVVGQTISQNFVGGSPKTYA